MSRIILASASPRRVELLKQLVQDFDVIPSDVDEEFDADLPVKNAERLALDKALDVADAHPDALVIGSDTIVWIEQKILGKPVSKEDAFDMLRFLSGKEHTVTTGVAMVQNGTHQVRSDSSLVRFQELSDETIQQYIETGEPMDKAGAYAIQGIGGDVIVLSHSGSFSNIVGLPVDLLAKMLNQ